MLAAQGSYQVIRAKLDWPVVLGDLVVLGVLVLVAVLLVRYLRRRHGGE